MDHDCFETEGFAENPSRLENLKDGAEFLLTGDVGRFAEFGHRAGENELGLLSTNGFLSCEMVLRSFGVEVDERQLVDFAVERGLCFVTARPEFGGSATLPDLAEVLTEFGVPARCEAQYSVESVADYIEEGRRIVVAINGTALWDEPWSSDLDQADSIVAVTGVARDPVTGDLKGFFVNDTNAGKFGEYVERDRMEEIFLGVSRTEGHCVVTDLILG